MESPKVALVTGGAVRVGAAITRALVDAGYVVWLHHHSSTDAARALAESAATNGDRPGVLAALRADLARPEERAELCRTVVDPDGPGRGRLDVLVNNAASFERGPFRERSDADLERVLALNLVAPLSLTRGCLPALERAGGCVVNILDVAGVHPWPDHLDHGVSKAGLRFATEALATELAPLRANAVAPGTVAWPTGDRFTEGSAARAVVESKIPLGHIGTPSDVAAAVLYFAEAGHVTGQILAVDGGRLAAIAGRHDA